MNRHELKHAQDSTRFLFRKPPRGLEVWEKLRTLASVWRSLTRESLDPSLPGTLTYTQMGVHVAEDGSSRRSHWPDVRVIFTGILCSFCHFAAHREESLLSQGKGPKVDAETVIHSQIPLERHCTIDPVASFLSNEAVFVRF